MNLLIKNILAVDAEHPQGQQQDLAIRGENFVAANTLSESEIDYVVDGKGRMAMPGLIDFHTHLFNTGSGFGLNADLLFSAGVTTAVDMGSAGRANYEAFYQTGILPRQMRVLSFLNVSPIGQPGAGLTEPLQESCFLPDQMEKILEKYNGYIKGLKVRVSKEIVRELGLEPLKNAVKLGEKWKMPVVVHTTNPPSSTEAIAQILRPGDVYSHTYQGKGHTILDDKGKVLPGIKQAQKDGVLFEVGQGRYNLDPELTKKALEDGFYPDIISTDSTPRTAFINKDMKHMPYMMSKFMEWGMSWEAVYKASVLTPAKVLGTEELATLAPETTADLLIFDFVETDGKKIVVPRATIAGGNMVYCQADF